MRKRVSALTGSRGVYLWVGLALLAVWLRFAPGLYVDWVTYLGASLDDRSKVEAGNPLGLPVLLLVTSLYAYVSVRRLPAAWVWPRRAAQLALIVFPLTLMSVLAQSVANVWLAVLMLLVVPLVWWWLPRVLAASDRGAGTLTADGRAEFENRVRGQVSQALALLLLAAVAILWLQLAAIRQEKSGYPRPPDTTRLGQAPTRFSRALELLDAGGPGNPAKRQEGIHSLKSIAGSPEYNWAVMEVLTSYVRQNAPRQGKDGTDAAGASPPAPDIQAVLRVIGCRVRPEHTVPLRYLDMRSVGLRKADLSNSLLYEVRLSDSDLREANMTGASLYSAELLKTDLSLCRLSGAKLTSAKLTAAVLRKANLRQADLSGSDLSDADLRQADLSGADLSDADLSGADLTGSDLSMATLSKAFLRGADLSTVIGLTQAALDSAYTDEHTRVPPPLVAGNKRANQR